MEDDSELSPYKPCKQYFKKKYKNEEQQPSNSEVQLEFSKLDEEKILKYIKKAEKKFDKDHADVELTSKNCFSTYLNDKEIELLIKSYEFPERVPDSIRAYYFKTTKIDENVKNILVEKTHKYLSLTGEEKNQLSVEYLKAYEDYIQKYSKFLNELPPNRFLDYHKFADPYKVKDKNHGSVKKVKSTILKNNAEPRSSSPRKSHAKKIQFFLPFEYYFAKNEQKYMDEQKKYNLAKIQARKDYSKLDDANKLIFIQQSVENFDKNNVDDIPLSPVLNKSELDVLFKSYGLPDAVPGSAHSYLIKKFCNDKLFEELSSIDRFKRLNEYIRALPEIKKIELTEEHAKKLAEFSGKMEAFKKKLPEKRQKDFKLYSKKHLSIAANVSVSQTNVNTRRKRNRTQPKQNGDVTLSDVEKLKSNESNDENDPEDEEGDENHVNGLESEKEVTEDDDVIEESEEEMPKKKHRK